MIKMNLINLDRTHRELTNFTLRTIRPRGSLQTSDPKVNLLIRLTTIRERAMEFSKEAYLASLSLKTIRV
jgi:hypothetical protein